MPELDFEAVLQKEDERLHEMGVYGDVGYADDEVEEYRKYVLERLGKNHKVEEDGDHLVIHSLKLTIYPPYDPDCVEGENPDSVKSIQQSVIIPLLITLMINAFFLLAPEDRQRI